MLDKKLLEAAADWWAEQISGYKLNWDNGAQNEGSAADRKTGQLMWMLGNINANKAREEVTPEKLQKFKESLIKRISERWENSVGIYREYPLILSVDYDPDEILRESVNEAEINNGVFPCKTCMWIDSKMVSAKLGYGSSPKIIIKL
jgi:hypothetical protein